MTNLTKPQTKLINWKNNSNFWPLDNLFDFRTEDIFNNVQQNIDSTLNEVGRLVKCNTHYIVDHHEDRIDLKFFIPNLNEKITKDDIDISFENETLKIVVNKNLENKSNSITNIPEKFNMEYRIGYRDVVIESENIKAKFDDNILEITLPKTYKYKKIQIE